MQQCVNFNDFNPEPNRERKKKGISIKQLIGDILSALRGACDGEI